MDLTTSQVIIGAVIHLYTALLCNLGLAYWVILFVLFVTDLW